MSIENSCSNQGRMRMKKLLITLLLISPFSFANWGDVYYCQMTTNSYTSLEGEKTDYRLEKIQFKLDKTKKAMVFGKSGKFKNVVMELREGANFPSIEKWYAFSTFGMSYFDKGKFLFSLTLNHGITSVSADCDKF